jgi:hypothetical protein
MQNVNKIIDLQKATAVGGKRRIRSPASCITARRRFFLSPVYTKERARAHTHKIVIAFIKKVEVCHVLMKEYGCEIINVLLN